MIDFLKEAEEIKETLREYRRYFHRHPETSGQEFKTAEFISEKLKACGLVVKEGVGAPLPGVIGCLKGGKAGPAGPTVALRADMDALFIDEAKDVPYRSANPGKMHACGHDCHMAIQLGAALILRKYRDELKGNVKFIFQPSEEMYGGAQPMIEDGALEDPPVDAVLALHVDSSFQTGEIGISYGETMAASDRLRIYVRGKSCHGAYPHQGVDAILIAAQILLAIQPLMAREKDTFHPAVLSFGLIEGGKSPNIVCEEVLLRGMCRTLNPETRETLMKRLKDICQGVAGSLGGSCEVIREISYESLINNDGMVDLIRQAAESLGGLSLRQLPRARMITEDFAYFAKAVPGAMWFLGTGNREKDTEWPLHSSHFDVDEDALAIGAALQAAAAWRYLEQHQG